MRLPGRNTVVAALACALTFAASPLAKAQDAPPGPGTPVPAPELDRHLSVGPFVAYTPVFQGSRDYQLIAAPNIVLRYDRIGLSLPEGLTYDVIRNDNWRVGPSLGLRPGREEDGSSPFGITGGSDALLGLGDIKATADVGGYAAYEAGGFGARVDVRQATNSDLGLIATLGVRYTARIATSSAPRARPVILTLGPRLSLVDDKYAQSYFGINSVQAARSGLAPFTAKGGLLSGGFGASGIVPLGGRLSGLVVAGYDRLAGDAGRSPLVRERGSRNQAMIAIGLSYRFGL